MNLRIRIIEFCVYAALIAVAVGYARIMVVSPRAYATRAYENPRIQEKIEQAVFDGVLYEKNGSVSFSEKEMAPFYQRLVPRLIRKGFIRAHKGAIIVEKNLGRRYNPHPGSGKKPLFLRGAILDRNGEALAWSEVDRFRVRRKRSDEQAFFHLLGRPGRRFAAFGIEHAADNILTSPLRPVRDFFRRFMMRPVIGKSVTTTLDSDLQTAVFRAFEDKRGGAVVLDIRNGDILAAVSAPALSFDAAEKEWLAAHDAKTAGPLLARAFDATYPPGSTFKTIIAAAAFETGVSVPGCPLVCRGSYRPLSGAAFAIQDHERHKNRGWPGHNPGGDRHFDIGEAYVLSCNCSFARIGVALGKTGIENWAQRFGFGKPIEIGMGQGIDPWKTSASIVWSQTAQPRRITATHVAQAAIGQYEVRASPLQMALVASAIANDGQLLQPHLIQTPALSGKRRKADGAQPIRSERILSRQTAAHLRSWMADVVERGTARSLKREGLPMAGKTGTAQTPNGAPHAWFMGFAPIEKPEIAFAVVVENGGFGSLAAGPIASTIVEAYLANEGQ